MTFRSAFVSSYLLHGSRFEEFLHEISHTARRATTENDGNGQKRSRHTTKGRILITTGHMRREMIALNIATVFNAKKTRYIDNAEKWHTDVFVATFRPFDVGVCRSLGTRHLTQAINMFIVVRLRVCCAKLACVNPLERLPI
jgi:hypothetical protein